MATLVDRKSDKAKLSDREKVEVKADAAIVATILGSDMTGVQQFVDRVNRNYRLLRQEGDMKGKRPVGATSHKPEDIAEAMVETVKRKGLIRVGD